MPRCGGKVRYDTDAQAQRHLRRARDLQLRAHTETVVTRTYECPRCRGWHLTSLDAFTPPTPTAMPTTDLTETRAREHAAALTTAIETAAASLHGLTLPQRTYTRALDAIQWLIDTVEEGSDPSLTAKVVPPAVRLRRYLEQAPDGFLTADACRGIRTDRHMLTTAAAMLATARK